MNILLEITDTLAKFEDWLENKCGPILGDLIQWFVFIFIPIILVLLPWKITTVFSMVISCIYIIIFFSYFHSGIFGGKEFDYEKGFLSVVNREGFKTTIYYIVSWLLIIISGYAVLFTSLEKLFPKAHFSISNPTVALIDFEYFSFVTIITLGYGDITPISWISKLLCISEIICGFFIFFISITIILGSYLSEQYQSVGLGKKKEIKDNRKANRVAGGFSPPAPTPPGMRVRTGRFIKITGP